MEANYQEDHSPRICLCLPRCYRHYLVVPAAALVVVVVVVVVVAAGEEHADTLLGANTAAGRRTAKD